MGLTIQHLGRVLKLHNMKTDAVLPIFISTLFLLSCHIRITDANDGLGSKCSSYKDCSQEKLLTCVESRSTCDCAFKSRFSSAQNKCVRFVGERCTISSSGPLPAIGCVDNANCVHEPKSQLPKHHGVCVCSHGYYRTEESFCFKNPTTSGSTTSNSNHKYPSLTNVMNSIPYSDEKSSQKNPSPYHHPLTRSSGVSHHLSLVKISSMIPVVVVMLYVNVAFLNT